MWKFLISGSAKKSFDTYEQSPESHANRPGIPPVPASPPASSSLLRKYNLHWRLSGITTQYQLFLLHLITFPEVEKK
jgi:hypothetical protein